MEKSKDNLDAQFGEIILKMVEKPLAESLNSLEAKVQSVINSSMPPALGLVKDRYSSEYVVDVNGPIYKIISSHASAPIEEAVNAILSTFDAKSFLNQQKIAILHTLEGTLHNKLRDSISSSMDTIVAKLVKELVPDISLFVKNSLAAALKLTSLTDLDDPESLNSELKLAILVKTIESIKRNGSLENGEQDGWPL